ncbi:Spectrin repeat superfamily Extracellular matrix-binding protein, putative [Babesia ovata]|uniref:Spectrin repeat superfamily Extracellular matrix-binding protein, putative n=1 Tax=Babesia ovata TaxID=189622 RepID=A0A2H6K8N7_9APIC|nr:Spectrin repeat superfamily Extracellular matrix-binding protein, putative [Babesia ovata]GBE59365.1 Spectrin repeat superfamily Extracellular matrix-binding protein, putative [Babesia ovata]
MAPKKLTDCPENLRESIDWLIQVRYGGDGSGLGMLAEALKKLIGEAVKDANESIKTEHDTLKMLVQSDPSKQKSLDEIEERQHKLAELSGHLAQFIGNSEAIKEAIKNSFSIYLDKLSKLLDPSKYYACCKSKNKLKFDEMKRLQDKLKNSEKLETIVSEINFKALLKPLEYNNDTCTHHHYKDSTTNEALQDVESKLESLAELGDSLDKFNNEPNTILTNICSGLETFLGFDDKTKGYTGSGIVYSDLDRLADGVVAFLLQCLKGSQTLLSFYYPNITQTIKDLEGKIGKGSGVKGFASAIGIVQRGLQRYESGMEGRISSLKHHLSQIQASVKAEISNIPKRQKEPLEGQLTHLSKIARQCVLYATLADKAFGILDEDLQGNIKCNILSVSQAANTFQEVTEKGEVKNQAKGVDTTLSEQHDFLKGLVNKGAQELESRLNGQFDRIQNGLTSLKNDKLKAEMGKVRGVVQTAKGLVVDCIADFDAIYEENIIKEFDRIKQNMEEITRVKKDVKYESKLFEEVEKLNKAVLELEKLYQEKLVKVKKAVEEAVDYALVKNRDHSLDKLDDHIRTDLEGLRGKILGQLEAFGKDVEKQILAAAGEAEGDTEAGKGLQQLITQFTTGNSANQFTQFTSALTQAQGSTFGLGGNIEGILLYINKLSQHPSESALYANLLAGLRRSLYSAIDSVLKGVITDPKNLITFDKNFMANYYKETMKQDGLAVGTLRGLITRIKEQFGSGFKGTGDHTAIDLTTLEGYNSAPSTSTTGNAAKPAYNKAVVSVKQTVEKVERLPEFVEQRKLEADEIMKDIKNQFTTLQGMTDKIDEAINSAESAMEQTILSIEGTLVDAEQKSRQAVNQLKSQLLTAVQSSFETLTSQVYALFAKQKQAELATLEKIVAEQLAAIERIIREDRANGLKGFLGELRNSMNGNLDIPEAPEYVKSIKLEQLSWGVRGYFEGLLDYVFAQLTTSSPPDSSKSYPKIVDGIKNNINVLLTDRTHFNKTASDHLAGLKKSHGSLVPDKFDGNNNKLLDLIRDGVDGFIKHLDYAYVNAYSEQTVKWKNTKLPDALALDDDELTENAIKCANVFCSIISILYEELSQLREDCKTGGNCEKKKIDLNNLLSFSTSGPTKTNTNPLGHFFKRCGFRVASLPDASNAELHNKPTMMGSHIFQLLVGHGRVFSHQDPDDDKSGDQSPVYKLLKHLHDYYKTCHLQYISPTKYPSTVRDMLHWLCGLWHNPVLGNVEQYFKTLFRKPKQYENTDYSAIPDYALKLEGTSNIQPYDLSAELYKVCSHAEKVLITILGYGDANGRYSCDFNTNPDDLSYPTNAGECLDWLIEICMRLNRQLYFLYNQCCNGKSSSGWLDCWYGKHVGGSSWRCNDKQCPKQDCDQKADQHYKCGLKSPLQSFLEDGLQGFLPHPYNMADCKMTCPLSNHLGKPCLTPMGFGDISTVASHTMRGQHLMKVLSRFCSKSDRPLANLCSYLTCLLQRPPQTLDEMLAFYHSLLNGWEDSGEHRQEAFQKAVENAYFCRQYNTLNPESICDSATHKADNHPHGDISSIINCNEKSSPVSPCGSYIHPLSYNTRCIYSKEHAEKYLSWIVYLTETFYDYLCRLLSKFEENCGTNESKCRIEGCANDCQIVKSSTHSSSCRSIIQCPYTLPTLYAEGFVFGNPLKIGGKFGNPWKRSCGDFIDQLRKVCGGKSLLAKLIHETIAEYLFKIRLPFIYTLLALWSLSLLYLLHIAVVRLDVLRIRSHLRSPASHRIAAQSLLAAARVKALNNVKYFSP